MKVQNLALFAIVALAACKNDKPATETNTVATTTTAPTTAITPTQTASVATPTAPVPSAPVAPATTVQVNQTNVSPVGANAGKMAAIKFNETSYDWGTMKEGDKMTHIFKFSNTGVSDLVISDAQGSCGCTVPEWPKEPIKPGKSGEIKVVFDSAHKSGPQTKTVTLTANTEPSKVTLLIKGNVEGKAE